MKSRSRFDRRQYVFLQQVDIPRGCGPVVPRPRYRHGTGRTAKDSGRCRSDTRLNRRGSRIHSPSLLAIVGRAVQYGRRRTDEHRRRTNQFIIADPCIDGIEVVWLVEDFSYPSASGWRFPSLPMNFV